MPAQLGDLYKMNNKTETQADVYVRWLISSGYAEPGDYSSLIQQFLYRNSFYWIREKYTKQNVVATTTQTLLRLLEDLESSLKKCRNNPCEYPHKKGAPQGEPENYKMIQTLRLIELQLLALSRR
jgi:hypothetical protein